MKSIIRWAVSNSPAMNTLMIGVLLMGSASLFMMRREVFPEFEMEVILITVPYPGASPDEVEEGICQKIEEAVHSITGIKKKTAVARESFGYLILELESNIPDVQKTLAEVRSEIDRIPSFPELAEDPEIKQITFRQPAIRVGILGTADDSPDAALRLREVTEQVRRDLLQLPSVSQANIIGGKDYQIDIEISETALRKHGLSLGQVAEIVRRQNLELPGGSIKTDSQEVLLRGKNKQTIGEEIAKIPLVTQSGGVVLTIDDLGNVQDEFADMTAETVINGRPGLLISVDRTASEDLLAIVNEVKEYTARQEVPAGYELRTWRDRSVDVRDRMDLLTRNGLQGLALVFLVLALFLELRLAFWVALGIPIAILGASAVLLFTGHTLNMLTMFAFLLALGIVVDDAIVIGENIYAHRQLGKPLLQAAIDGTAEVVPAVVASVATTIIAFLPLMYVSGVMGKFIAVMPVAVIAMLVISLVESSFVLPCHLAHKRGMFLMVVEWLLYPFRPLAIMFGWMNRYCIRLLDWFIKRVYVPTLRKSVNNPAIVISGAIALMMICFGLIAGGIAPWSIFPKLDSNTIIAKVVYPDGTPSSITDEATQRMEEAIVKINQKYADQGMNLVDLRRRTVGSVSTDGPIGAGGQSTGSNVGEVTIELVPPEQRSIVSLDIVKEWREGCGEFPGAQSVSFRSPSMGPEGLPIEFRLLADESHFASLEAAVEECKTQLRKYPGVADVADDSTPGKWEFQIKVKEDAQAMGVTVGDLAETVRNSYYGAEVMRLQRGRHEVKLMVRYPTEERQSLTNFNDIRVRTDDGAERPLTELADITVARSYGEINRIDQMRSITVTADMDEQVGNTSQTMAALRSDYMPKLLAKYPGVYARYEGEAEQTQDSVTSMMQGFVVAVLGMFVLLTVQFRSYLQPLLILAIIPFGMIGAVIGHAFMGLPISLFSLFGLVALTGVVVNDSIVLVDFINSRLGDGLPLKTALLEAGERRFRPVLLTSVTTVAGLAPMLAETSFQAQILIPMAVSLCFGLMLATVLVLYLVPVFYLVYYKTTMWFESIMQHDDELDDQPAAEPESPLRKPNYVNGNQEGWPAGDEKPQVTDQPATVK
ncbi:Multidrug resistance protein MdtB [Symmachiella dynata]|uniref:Multidrug resistance protein MdtB n=1 Tax=Symmachiella dynata TaxID=2527995 RepID=A0A517ZYT9_9PLAN|nr:efflux RND transporter permease subunit [Symmachiella dynata]QDU47654.1 Multidrug resistance protein MdtB [Symmachiella dynata]